MRAMMLSLLWLLPTDPVRAEGDPNSYCGITLSAGALEIRRCDLSFARQKDRVIVLFDVFPYKARLASKGENALEDLARSLAEGPAREKYPDARQYRVAIAEVAERDVYGLPRWDTLKMVLRRTFLTDKKGGLVLEPAEPPKKP